VIGPESESSGSPPEGRGRRANAGLLDLVQLVALTTPGFVRMRRHPELGDWAATLSGFSEHAEVQPLARTLKRIVELQTEGPSTFGPMFELFAEHAPSISFPTLVSASRISSENRKAQPYASFMLAWVAICLWIVRARLSGQDLYAEELGWPNVGWRDLPAACIEAAIELHGLHGASQLTAETYAVLQTNARRRLGNRAALAPAIATYHRLARTLASRHEMAVAGLADDLREACRVPGRARRLVAALLWTMGLVPESRIIGAIDSAPPRPLIVRLIRSSFRVLPTDPLVQYLWLEMKDAPEIDLRAHDALYAVLNHRWAQWRLDEMHDMFGFSAEPSRLYGRALEALLAGDLDDGRAAPFLQAYDFIEEARLGGAPASFILARLHVLRFLIGERLGYLADDVTARQKVEWLADQTARAANVRRAATMIPEAPEAATRTGIAMHEVIERLLADDSNVPTTELDRLTTAFAALESFRTGALAYWLEVIAPLPPAIRSEALEQCLTDERDLVERVRGAYFLALRPTLPLHFLWSDMDLSEMIELSDPAKRAAFYSADHAREEKTELDRQLVALADRLSAEAPTYAKARQHPATDIARVTSMLTAHRRP
jgi:hypothetical protein